MALELDMGDLTENISVDADIYIVSGSNLDLVERSLLDLLESGALGVGTEVQVQSKDNLSVDLRNVTIHYVDDSEESLKEIRENNGIVFLFGDVEHNKLTDYYMGEATSWEDKSLSYGQLNLKQAKGGKGDFVVVSHPRSRNKLRHEAAKTSPLRHFVPLEYVPIAAAGSGLGMMFLVNIMQTVFEFKALKFGRKKRKVREFHRKIGPIKVEETLAVLGASFILGLSITFTFFGFTSLFLRKLVQNWGLCLFAALSHEVSHRMVGKLFNIHIEYHFWWTGSALTLVTGYLGHPFSIQGFLMERVEGKVSKWKYGLTKLAAPAFSWAIMVFFAYLNYNNPSEIYQIIFATAGLWATAEILPFNNLDGKDIRAWSHLIWLFSFLLIFASFIVVNFVI